MFLRTEFQYFVTLNDITQRLEEYNPVLYNPGKDEMPFRRDLLYRVIKEHTGVELTSDELVHLIQYEVHELDKFVIELRKIVMKNKLGVEDLDEYNSNRRRHVPRGTAGLC